MSYVNSSKYNLFILYCWLFGNQCCLFQNDCLPAATLNGQSFRRRQQRLL